MAKRGGKSKGGVSAPKTIFEMPELPDELLSQLFDALSEEDLSSLGEEESATEALESAFEDFLDLEDPEERDEPADEVFSELSDCLDRVRVEANGGDPEAREGLKAFHARLAAAIADEEVHPGNLIMLGKVIWRAGIPIDERLREAVGKAFSSDRALAPENAEIMALRAIGGIEDPFDIYDEAASNMAAFPTKFRIAFALPLVASRKSALRMAAAGFVLHPDEELARAVIKAFPFSAEPSAAENAIVNRLTQVAAWLPRDRREMAQAAFAAMPAGKPGKVAANPPVRIVASAHDGSGANSLMASVKAGKRFLNLSLLIKSNGVVEVIDYPDLLRDEAEQLMGLMGRVSPTVDIDIDGAAKLLALALGRNVVGGSPPPFRLVQFCEAVGLTDLRPDPSTAAETLDKMLAGAPLATGAVDRAHAEIVDSDFVDSWFEAGERIEKLLSSTKSRKTAVRKVLNDYLPSRRPFWAMLCATSALVLKSRVGGVDDAWKTFALVGRDIASETPVDRIPLMNRIAESTAEAFFARS